MSDLGQIRACYMRGPLPVRLGGIAGNLARIRSCAARGIGSAAIADMLREGAYMIESTARDAEVEVAAQLAESQVRLALWSLRWSAVAGDQDRHTEMSGEAGEWSDRVLAMSGLAG